ncbi:MAG: VTT domain-containing protein [Parasporobacterium sp.]|nr:VTT domain-containing protein [Parasporobacterium sp.]
MTKTAKRIFIICIVLVIIALFVFFFRDILIPLFKMQTQNDLEGAKSLLLSKGFLGGLSVVLVEALQMVVIFIPAEFIQISSGLSYPFYIALLLCDLGVCLGASIIFVLVRAFRFDTGKSKKTSEEIGRISTKTGNKNTQLFMYLLFIMPIIPFGAICYYGSSTKISYPRYLLTVATGVIPSIITSNLIGTTAKAFIMNSIPLWLLIVILIILAAALFAVIWIFLNKFYFKEGDGTPDSALYYLLFKFIRLVRGRRQRLHIDGKKLEGMKAPFVVLCNHESFYDFYYVSELLQDYNPSYVLNSHYSINPITGRIIKRTGLITKKLFYPDKAALKIARTVRAGYPVVIFPEGRLSPDGRNNPIVEDASALYQVMKTDLVIVKIKGAYFMNPKWRSSFFRSDVYVSVKTVITKEELLQMSREELGKRISAEISFNESEEPSNQIKNKNRAKGLENLLYRCADCGTLYSTTTKGEDLICSACGSVHHLDERGLFTGEIESIPAYYDRIKEMEKENLDQLVLKAEVKTKIFSSEKPRVRKEKGACTFSRESFSYHSDSVDFTIPTENLPALAFSCNKEFELYYKGEEYFFYPEENSQQVARWGLFADLLKEERDDKSK